MDPNKAFQEYKDTQERIKQMCIEYVKTYFKPSDKKAILKYMGENNHKLKFYIDEQGIPKFRTVEQGSPHESDQSGLKKNLIHHSL